jgi:hypothetical protein
MENTFGNKINQTILSDLIQLMQRRQHKEILICIDKDNLSIPMGAIGENT